MSLETLISTPPIAQVRWRRFFFSGTDLGSVGETLGTIGVRVYAESCFVAPPWGQRAGLQC